MLEKMKIKTKLMIVIGITLVLMIFIGVMSSLNLKNINNKMKQSYEKAFFPTTQLAAINKCILNIRTQIAFAMMHDPRNPEMASMHKHEISLHTNLIKKEIDQINKKWPQYKSNIHKDDIQLANSFEQSYKEINEKGFQILLKYLKDENFSDAYKIMMDVINKEYQKINQSMDNLIKMQVDDGKVNYQESKAIYKSNQFFFIVLIIVSLVVSLLLGFLLIKSIIGKLQRFTDVFSKGAQGDLNALYPMPKVDCAVLRQCGKNECPNYGKLSDDMICYLYVGSYAPQMGREVHCPAILSGKYKDCKECNVYHLIARNEIFTMAAFYNEFMIKIKEIITSIKKQLENLNQNSEDLSANAQETAASVREISASVDSVNQNMHEQNNMMERSSIAMEKMLESFTAISNESDTIKNQIDQASTALEEMTATISNSTKLAENGDQAAEKLENISDNGKEGMAGLTDSIENVSKSSEKIVEMVQLIMDISEQTNLLAMNAAIEAAHAGEYGKGFAVVAEEIRKLADKSSTGAKQIQEVVKNISHEIEENLSNANKTRDNFDIITSNVKGVSQINHEIAAGMEEQKIANRSILESISVLKEMGESIASKTNQEKESSVLINKDLHQLNLISQEVATAIEEERNGLNESSTASEHISAIAEDLNQMVSKLRAELEFFKNL